MTYTAQHSSRAARRTRLGGALILTIAAGLSSVVVASFVTSAEAAPTAVGLGTADSFAVLAGTGITNSGPTTIDGDIGSSPTPSVTGEDQITFVRGSNRSGDDAVVDGAKTDLVEAYDDAASQGPPIDASADLGGQTLVSGVYKSVEAMSLTGRVTLDGEGKTDGVWVFQAGSTLNAAVDSRVRLTNGARACNVFWQVGSSATIMTNARFRGTVLALESISMGTGATVEGRLLARNGAVTLLSNTITLPGCAQPPGDGTTPDGTTPDGTTQDGDTQDGDTQDGDTQDGDTQDGDTQDGDTQDGDTQDGDTQDGDTQDGDTQDGDTQDGDTQDGDTQDGDTQDGDTQDGDTQDGDTQDGDTQDGDGNDNGGDDDNDTKDSSGTDSTNDEDVTLPDTGGPPVFKLAGSLALVLFGVATVAYARPRRRLR